MSGVLPGAELGGEVGAFAGPVGALAGMVIGGLVGSFLSSTFLIPSILTFLEKTSPIPEKEERS